MTSRPLFYLALINMIIGVQFFLAGFLAEMIQSMAPNKNNTG